MASQVELANARVISPARACGKKAVAMNKEMKSSR